jgi:hypothetical protein
MLNLTLVLPLLSSNRRRTYQGTAENGCDEGITTPVQNLYDLTTPTMNGKSEDLKT